MTDDTLMNVFADDQKNKKKTTKIMTKTSKSSSLESKLERLETIALSLENDNLSLDLSLKIFEEGINLTNECQILLENAEQRITEVLSSRESTSKANIPRAHKSQQSDKADLIDQVTLDF